MNSTRRGIVMFTLTPLVNPDLNISINDYQPVASLISEDFILCTAPAKSGLATWRDVVDYGKANRIVVGCNPPGAATHMFFSAIFGKANIVWDAVSSQGGNKDLLNLVSGDVVIVGPSAATQYIEKGMITPIACMSSTPYTGFDGYTVPTLQSEGIDIVFNSNNFIFAKKGVDMADVNKFHDAWIKYQSTDEFKDLATNASFTPNQQTVEEIVKQVNDAKAFSIDVYNTYYKK